MAPGPRILDGSEVNLHMIRYFLVKVEFVMVKIQYTELYDQTKF
jgi:hypothetical protein